MLTSLLLASAPAGAQIRINEIYANPPGTAEPEERVEIYNAGSVAIDVTGWAIHDLATIDGNPTPARCWLPEDFDPICPGGALIQPGEYRLVKVRPVWSTMGQFNNAGDDVYLCSNRTIPATIVHQVTYVNAPEGQSWEAEPNGSSNFSYGPPTLCASNVPLGDVIAPSTVLDLVAAPGTYSGEIRLTWTAPGDDGASGTATLYEIKVSNAPINSGNFAAARDLDRWLNKPDPSSGGTPETLVVFGFAPESTWCFALRAQDEVPNTGGVSNSPCTAPFGGPLPATDLGYTPYFGNLHSHTSYSDGVQTPAAAYSFARNTAPTPLDFLAVTEHNHAGEGMTANKYDLLEAEAAAANDDGNFVAIFGQEWGIASEGHINVFEAPVLFGWDAGIYEVFVAQGDYAGLYTAAMNNPPTNGHPVILEFCHPAGDDFDNFQVTPNGMAAVRLMALVNGPSNSTSTTESDIGHTNFDPQLQEALMKGFRVSPTGDQDNHNATWGASTQSRTAVLANAKTKSEILNAMWARRTYATQDHNVRVDFAANGHAMGEAFASPNGVRIAVHITDPDPSDAVTRIELFRGITGALTPAVMIAHNLNSPTLHWRELDTFAPMTEVHYYLRIQMADNQRIWTGPIYVTYDPAAPLAVGDRPAGALALAVGPNPALRRVTATFSLPRAESRARVTVYDPSGRRVRTLLDGPVAAGEHRVAWDATGDDGRAVQAGLYFVRVEAGAAGVTRKVLLLK